MSARFAVCVSVRAFVIDLEVGTVADHVATMKGKIGKVSSFGRGGLMKAAAASMGEHEQVLDVVLGNGLAVVTDRQVIVVGGGLVAGKQVAQLTDVTSVSIEGGLQGKLVVGVPGKNLELDKVGPLGNRFADSVRQAQAG